MSGGSESWLVKCPFYHRQKDTKIICEGIAKGSTINIVLSNRSAKNSYQKEYCRKDWQKCLIAKALNTKYESEESGRAEVS